VDTYDRIKKPIGYPGAPEGKVKVTVNLDAALVKLAKKLGIDRNVTLGELIEEGLRVVLARKGRESKPPKG